MPSIGRTHGHLLFSATAGSPGTWRGGETAIRRGDVVQWLSAKIKPVGQPHVTMTLGEPDHTAIVVSDVAVAGLENGYESDNALQALNAAFIGPLEVVEQSVREVPTRRTYDMSQFLSGQVSNKSRGTCKKQTHSVQVWIYRPVAMEAYIGISQVAPSWPPPLPPDRVHAI